MEDRLGGVLGEFNVSFWKTLPRSVVDSLKLLIVTVLFGGPLFVLGFIPVVGEIVAAVAGAMVGAVAGATLLSRRLFGQPDAVGP